MPPQKQSRLCIALLVCCMFHIVLCSLVSRRTSASAIRSFASASRGGTCTFAFARQLPPSRDLRLSLRTRIGSAGDRNPSLSRLSSSSSSSKETDNTRATGWMHNQPKPRSEKSNGIGTESKQTSQTPKDPSGEPATGWLHNTRPKGGMTSSKQESEAVRLLRAERGRKQRRHRILCPPAFHPCDGRLVVVTEHAIAVPVVHHASGDDDDSEGDASSRRSREKMPAAAATIDVFFTIAEVVENEREERFFRDVLGGDGAAAAAGKRKRGGESPATAVQEDRASAYVRHAALSDMDEGILYLQGGPGFGAPRPVSGIGLAAKSSWAGEALGNGFKRVVLLDQRGTGRSSPITKQTLESRFPELFSLDESVDSNHKSMTVTEAISSLDGVVEKDALARFSKALDDATEYMSNFRADSIVRDAECVKEALLLPCADEEPRPWGGALGQSFGGFCMMTYLSKVETPPRICLLTGGIAPMLTPVRDAYDSLWDRVRERNLRYYDLYPGDIAVVKRIVRKLLDNPERLPSDGVLTARRFLQLGLGLGGSPSSFASLHGLVSSALIQSGDDEEDAQFSRAFLKSIDSAQPFDDHPIYFLLHESIYADGPKASPTAWAAHQVFEERTKNPSEFSYELTAKLPSDERPTLFFGEMVFPWMADGDYAELSGFGMRALSHVLALKDDWTHIYDASKMKMALDTGVSKAAAAVYFDDMYVDFGASTKVTRRGEALEKCKVWVTNEYQHSGLRDNGAAIFTKLLQMAKGSTGTPS